MSKVNNKNRAKAPKKKVIPIYFNNGKYMVYDVNTKDIYTTESTEAFFSTVTAGKFDPNAEFMTEKLSGNYIIVNIATTQNRYAQTIVEVGETSVTTVDAFKKFRNIPFEYIQDLLDKRLLNNLKIKRSGFLINSIKTIRFKINRPEYLKDGLNEDWTIVGSGVNTSKLPTVNLPDKDPVEMESGGICESTVVNPPDDPVNPTENCQVVIEAPGDTMNVESDNSSENSDNQSANNQDSIGENEGDFSVVDDPEEPVVESFEDFSNYFNSMIEEKAKELKPVDILENQLVDVHFNITEDNIESNIGSYNMTYLDFYKIMIDNSRVGDIISMPVEIFEKLNYEFIKVLEGSFTKTRRSIITKINTYGTRSNTVVGIALFDDSRFVTFQVMQKPLDMNSVSLSDIEINYYKWKQSRKYIN